MKRNFLLMLLLTLLPLAGWAMTEVAQIGTGNDAPKYPTLQEAIADAVDGDVIYLLGDINEEQQVAYALGKENGGSYTLDMNGHNITAVFGWGNPDARHLFNLLTSNTNWTITNSATENDAPVGGVISGSVENVDTDNDIAMIRVGYKSEAGCPSGSSLTIGAGVRVVSLNTMCAIDVMTNKTGTTDNVVNIYGSVSAQGQHSATGKPDEGYAVGTHGNPDTKGGVINVYDGAEINGVLTAIYLPAGECNILGGTISGATAGIIAKAGTLTISGGKIESSANEISAANWTWDGGASFGVGHALQVEQGNYPESPVTVQVIGGKFVGPSPVVGSYAKENEEDESFTALGKFLQGGNFSDRNLDGFVADGYVVVEDNTTANEDAPYKVIEKTHFGDLKVTVKSFVFYEGTDTRAKNLKVKDAENATVTDYSILGYCVAKPGENPEYSAADAIPYPNHVGNWVLLIGPKEDPTADGIGVSNVFEVKANELEMQLAQIDAYFHQGKIYAKYTMKGYQSGDTKNNVTVINDEVEPNYLGQNLDPGVDPWWDTNYDPNKIGAFEIEKVQDFEEAGHLYEYTVLLGTHAHAVTVIDDVAYENYEVKLVTNAQANVETNKITVTFPEALGKIYGDPDDLTEITVKDQDDANMLTGYDNKVEVTVAVSRAKEGKYEDAGEYDIYVDVTGDDAVNYEIEGADDVEETTDGYRYTFTKGYGIAKRDLSDENVVTETADRVYKGALWNDAPDYVKFYLPENSEVTADNQSNAFTAATDDKGAFVLLVKDADYTVGNFKDNKSVQYDGETIAAKSKFDITAVADNAETETVDESSKNFTGEKKDEAFKIVQRILRVKVVQDGEAVYGEVPAFKLEEVETDATDDGFVDNQTFTSDFVNLTGENVVFDVPADLGAGTYTVTADLSDWAKAHRGVTVSPITKAVARNYDVRFEDNPNNLIVDPLSIVLAAIDQEIAYPAPVEGVYAKPTASKGKTTGTWEAVNTVVSDATVSVSGGTLPADVDLASLVTLTCDVTKVGENANALLLTKKANTGNNIEFTVKSGKLTVSKLEEIHLSNENVAQALEDHKGQEGIDVYLPARDLYTDKWNTMILPFKFRTADLAHKLWYGMVEVLDKEDASKNYKFKEVVNGDVEANEPFILKVAAQAQADELAQSADQLKTVKFDNVTISDKDANGDDVYYNDVTKWPSVQDAYGNSFYGQYTGKTGLANYEWAISTNPSSSNFGKFLHGGSATANTKFAPTIAFLENKDQTAAEVRIFIEEEDGTITAIEGVGADVNNANAEGIYNLSGQRVNKAQKGIFIKDGKKVLVK